MTAKIFIDGEVGTTGLQIKQRLAGRNDLSLIHLDEANRKDKSARQTALQEADIAILCLPDAASIEAVELAAGKTRFIDASTAHRVNPDWCFGFPEMTKGQRQAIETAQFVSNPGCYSTAAIALLRPLQEAGLLPADYRACINAVSGYTGGGKQMIAEFQAGNAGAFFVYGMSQMHKHLPEIVKYSGLSEQPVFVPSVGNFAQGMAVQIPLHLPQLAGNPTLQTLHDALSAHYAGEPNLVVNATAPDRLDPEAQNGTNRLEITVAGDNTTGRAVLIATLDNLGKGASGAAVQNLNLMLGVAEDTGL
jgi:N-acetyl-gamma-glutamyl-phosphate reductase